MDYTPYLNRTKEWAKNYYPDECKAMFDAFPANHIDCIHGLTTMQFRIRLNGTETERDIKALLNQRERYAMLLNTNTINVYRDKREIVVEMPSNAKNTVCLGDLYSDTFRNMSGLPLMMGMDTMKNPVYYDLTKAPHMLVAGTTGSGKSIFMHAVIDSLIMHDANTEIYMIDPKMTEYNVYDYLKTFHLVKEVDQAIDLLSNVADNEMENRYRLFDREGVRDIEEAHEKGIDMKHIVVMIDELADLIMTSRRQVEYCIVRLAQKARACGIHLVLATQRPTADVVTGLIKANVPTKVCFKVNSSLDSRIILDRNGGETITAKGEMLFLRNGDFEPVRLQGCFMTATERKSIVSFTLRHNMSLLDSKYTA